MRRRSAPIRTAPARTECQVGQTRTAGFQVGARRTLPLTAGGAWALLTSPEGIRAWLGDGDVEAEAGRSYRLADGRSGEVRFVVPDSRLRVTCLAPVE